MSAVTSMAWTVAPRLAHRSAISPVPVQMSRIVVPGRASSRRTAALYAHPTGRVKRS
jgi:hypothetical protein